MKLQLDAIKTIGTPDLDRPSIYEKARARTLSRDTAEYMTASGDSEINNTETPVIRSSSQPVQEYVVKLGAHETVRTWYRPGGKVAYCMKKCKFTRQICCNDSA